MSKYMDLHILVLIAYAQKPPLNVHANISSRATCRDLIFDLTHHLHPYIVHASSEGSGESMHLYMLI